MRLPTRFSLRSFFRRLHLWLGLSVGLLFVLMGLTGSALVFYEDIDRLLHPALRVSAPGAAPGWEDPVWDRALSTVRARWPDRTGAWRFEATGVPGPIPARYQAPGEGHHGRRVMVWLTPDGTQVLREATWGRYAMTWIYDLHMELLAHAPGRAFVGWSGLVMLVLLLSGLWAWWPKGGWAAAWHFKRGAVPSRRLRDIHKWAGLLSLPLLLMLVATGTMLALPEPSNAVLARTVGAVAASVRAPVVAPSSAMAPGITVAQALAAAHRVMPQGRLAWVEAPGQGAFMVRVQQPDDPSFRFPHSHVFVDPLDGHILAVQDRERFGPGNVVNNWLHPLHDASVGGWPLRVLVLLMGLSPLLLFITGLLRWWIRRRAGRPSPQRGGPQDA
ncbi:PepSY domain-containing protein [Roseateles sp. YR242]|uniref:PepSY-associated TM helix domain-containing protein n=1 Tax=Roseateles sp. YR242 TaxID=1855305 RepID=UPI000B820EF0|nr:PepSY-associated TM helix domain-containing protein [Roseateles sp. YR242]